MGEVTIVTSTYFPPGDVGAQRARIAAFAVRSWSWRLRSPLKLRLHVADDGSEPAHFVQFEREIAGVFPTTVSRQQRRGLGASLNAGFAEAFKHGDLVMYVVDDIALKAHVDLSFPAAVLINEPSIGAVRIGLPHRGVSGTMRFFGGFDVQECYMLELEPEGYALGQRPALWHRRLYEALGPFREGVNALMCDQDYNERFCKAQPFKIMQLMPTVWEHCGTTQLSAIEPERNEEREGS